MKKFIINNICYILMFFVLIGVFIFSFSIDNSYNHRTISNKKWMKIINKRKENNKLQLDQLTFNDNSLFYDNDSNTWYYSIPNEPNNYNPKIGYKVKKNTKIVFNSKIKSENIKNNKTIKLMIYNKKYYRIYSLSLTTLPLINISYNSDKEIERDTKTDIDFTLFDNQKGVKDRIIKSNASIHLRGVSSLSYPKKGYRISLKDDNGDNNHLNLLDMRIDDDWILYSAYNDPEKIRNVFASNLWYDSSARSNQFNVKNGVQYKYVELFMNHHYWGLYALGYPIDKKQLNLSSDEYLFKKRDWATSEQDVLKNKELDKLQDYDLINNVNDSNEAWRQLINYYYNLQTSKNIDDIYDLVDIGNEIDYYLFMNIIQGRDNVNDKSLKNSYITLKKVKNKYIAFYTPWDLDMTFGNTWSSKEKNYTNINDLKYNDNIDFNLSSIKYLIDLDDKNIIKKIKNRYKYLRKNTWSNKYLNDLIDNYEEDIYNSGAFDRDKIRWVESSYNSEKVKLNDFRKYVLKRFKYFDSYIESL